MASCPSRYTDALILGSFRTRLISDSTKAMLSPGNKRRFTIASAVGGTTFSFVPDLMIVVTWVVLMVAAVFSPPSSTVLTSGAVIHKLLNNARYPQSM